VAHQRRCDGWVGHYRALTIVRDGTEDLESRYFIRYLPRKFRHRLLLNQRGVILATALRRGTDVVVATVPFRPD
jgi:hypothetical protein